MKKNKDLKYDREILKKLSPEELVKLLIKETSHQDAMNIIRKEFTNNK